MPTAVSMVLEVARIGVAGVVDLVRILLLKKNGSIWKLNFLRLSQIDDGHDWIDHLFDLALNSDGDGIETQVGVRDS